MTISFVENYPGFLDQGHRENSFYQYKVLLCRRRQRNVQIFITHEHSVVVVNVAVVCLRSAHTRGRKELSQGLALGTSPLVCTPILHRNSIRRTAFLVPTTGPTN